MAYLVLLAAVGNPDMGQAPGRLPGVPGGVYSEAESLNEASRLCRTYIERYDLGAGNWAGGRVVEATLTPDTARAVAQISYNGRVWPVEAK